MPAGVETIRARRQTRGTDQEWARETLDPANKESTMDAHVKDGEAARCPLGFGKHGRANRDWWPNNLSLQMLNQHAPRSNPLGADFD